MKATFIVIKKLPENIAVGIKQLAPRVGISLGCADNNGIEIEFKSIPNGLRIQQKCEKIIVGYSRPSDAFRALTHVACWQLEKLSLETELQEERGVENVYVMLDVSRNAVVKPERIKEWLSFMALCGINGLMLYTEDTYKLSGHEYFGYMRGGYSSNDLSQLDRLAAELDIEIIPCIQTLAHLTRVLEYPVYKDISENRSVLLPGSGETMSFVEEMLRAASAPFRSQKIHIGMDEAWGLGRGKYLTLNGYRPSFELMTEHLQCVAEITEKLGLEPMMWSDMFFRILSPTGRHYDPNIQWTPEVLAKIPSNIKQVYWNYYHSKSEDYTHYIELHQAMCDAPAVATGVQTWGRFWPAYEQTEHALNACFTSCHENNVKDVIITMWGDDGTECNYSTALPLLVFAAELNFTGKACRQLINAKTKLLTETDYDTWRLPAELDTCNFSKKTGRASNWSKALLWDDPMLGFWTAQLEGQLLNQYYSELVKKLRSVNASKHEKLCLPLALAEVLKLKADLPILLREAYKANDIEKLLKLRNVCSDKLIPCIEKLNHIHRHIWHNDYRPFGWEVLERRYGGIRSIIENLCERIDNYLNCKIECLEELETVPLKKFDMDVSEAYLNSCAAVYSSGQIFHIMDE